MWPLFSRLSLAGMLLISPVAGAHDDSYFDGHPTPHGGQMRMAGPYHLAVVTDAGQLIVFVTDHAGTPLSTVGWRGRAILLAGKQKSEYSLQPWSANGLRSTETVTGDPDIKLVVSVVAPAKAPGEQARFTRLSSLQ